MLQAAAGRQLFFHESPSAAAGRRTTVAELARAIGELTGSAAAPEHQPERPGDVRHSLASIDAARRELGFDPRVGLEEGLARSLEHYRKTVGGG